MKKDERFNYLLDKLYDLTVALESTSISIELLNHRGYKSESLVTYGEWLLERIEIIKKDLRKEAPKGFNESWIKEAESSARKAAL